MKRQPKNLLKSGSLKKRVTFISLNRVTSNKIEKAAVEYAKGLVGADRVWEASELVECDKNLRVAIDFVFGRTLICESSNEAKKLAYDKKVNCRCVTLNGDVFESSGTLTGGSRPTQNSLLLKQKELRSLKQNLDVLIQKERKLNEYIETNRSKCENFKAFRKNIDEKQLELELIKSKMKSSNRFQLQESVSELNQLINASKEEEKKLTKEIENEVKIQADLESKAKNETAFKEETIKKHKNNVDKLKKQLNALLSKIGDMEPRLIDLENQNEELLVERDKLLKNEKEFETNIEEFVAKVANLETILLETREKVSILEKEIEEIKNRIAQQNQHIQALNNQKSDLSKQLFEFQLKAKELDQNITALKQSISQTSVAIHETLNQNTWIEGEEKNFNNPDGIYNFSAMNFKEIKDRMVWLDDSVKKLKRQVNTRAMNMLSQAEDKFNELMKKKKIVESDRNKIQSMIKDLDIEKNEALKISSKKVNTDFGNIFSTLLPGASAKLCLIENKNILQGLEIRVGFGNTWKESLNELSGGQRSLVALSLILSLLLFKPAPIYILDEIDAALDISHTQNIGVMLQTHFRQSQFIIVSLKDGLFSNANVLFKTRFINGISQISRHANENKGNQKENDLPRIGIHQPSLQTPLESRE
ncbi:Structural maintenance of chromosomes protein 2 [Thelohanellus kitauei]|uniref:Structural maintenance of chromosomes protein 2 n=1 Tax=Thelohanellus kitauei TaxID=669202 RepID=A0A0C2J2Y8_THEKT|nr:Structural maintenance of chromosomes protein 2 [Thelohanellus kitauei]